MIVPPPVLVPQLVPASIPYENVDGAAATRWQRTRVFVKQRVVAHPAFDRITLVFILANCVFLALDNPLDSPQSRIQHVLVISDMVCASHCVVRLNTRQYDTDQRVGVLCVCACLRAPVPSCFRRYFWRCSHSR
jgi:hypothetical protein